MAETLPNIPIPKNSTVDLFQAVADAGRVIKTGERLRVVNIGSSEVQLYAGPAEPSSGDGHVVLHTYAAAENSSDDTGAFATSISSNGKLAVEVI